MNADLYDDVPDTDAPPSEGIGSRLKALFGFGKK